MNTAQAVRETLAIFEAESPTAPWSAALAHLRAQGFTWENYREEGCWGFNGETGTYYSVIFPDGSLLDCDFEAAFPDVDAYEEHRARNDIEDGYEVGVGGYIL